MIDETTQKYALSVIDVDCPFSPEELRLCVWKMHCTIL